MAITWYQIKFYIEWFKKSQTGSLDRQIKEHIWNSNDVKNMKTPEIKQLKTHFALFNSSEIERIKYECK